MDESSIRRQIYESEAEIERNERALKITYNDYYSNGGENFFEDFNILAGAHNAYIIPFQYLASIFDKDRTFWDRAFRVATAPFALLTIAIATVTLVAPGAIIMGGIFFSALKLTALGNLSKNRNRIKRLQKELEKIDVVKNNGIPQVSSEQVSKNSLNHSKINSRDNKQNKKLNNRK